MIKLINVENTNKSILFWSGFAILLSTSFLVILNINEAFYFELARENANAELLTAFFYFLAGTFLLIFTIRKSAQNKHKGNKLEFIFPLFFALFFLFIAGEEESWGQWLFDYQLPESVKEANYQEEINIHNLNFFLTSLVSTHFILNLFAVLCGIIFPICYHFSTTIRSFMDRLHFPVCPLLCGPFIICGIINERVGVMILDHWSHCEIKEFIFSIAFFLFSISVLTEKNKILLNSKYIVPKKPAGTK